MAGQRDPKNVKKLAADAAQRAKAKPKKPPPTVAKKIRLIGGKPPPVPPKPRGKPNAVLKLITDAINRKDGRG
jgi:hypothetical protein